MPWDHSIEINQDVTIKRDVTIQPGGIHFLSTCSSENRIDVYQEIHSDSRVSVGNDIDGQLIHSYGNITANGDISACGNITACGELTAKTITSQCSITTRDITASGNIDGGIIHASGDITAGGDITGGTINAQNSITLSGETIFSWAELKGPAGPSIQRFTSPELPANCSQFYFEGCNLVTGSELPFIQVRETATGKLVQMDVWVNLDGCCSGYTVGKPVANIAPCSTATEAGAWTAIVMN